MSLKKNKSVIFFLLGLWLMAAAGVSGASEESVKTIHIITPEWEGQTNPDGTGLFFDIIRAVYRPSGIKMRFFFAPWKRCQANVDSGRADAMLCVWKPHAREHHQLIPRYPFYVEQTAVVFKKASLIQWSGMHSLDYMRAVWLRGYNYQIHEAMAPIQLVQWHEADSHAEAWRLLNHDRIDVYIDSLTALNHYISENHIDMNLYQTEILWRTKAYVAFADTPRAGQLIPVFDRGIRTILDSGELSRIYEKWNQPFFAEYWRD